MEYATIVSTQVVIMFVLMAIGFLCSKIGIISNAGRKQISSIVMTIVMPALIFMAYQKEFSEELAEGLLWSFVLSVISHAITIPITYFLVQKNEKHEFILERLTLIFTNCAFMGIPLINSLFGSDGVLYVTAYITIFNLLVWTYGVMMIKNEISLKGLKQSLKTPTVIAIFLGLICYFLQIKIPQILGTAVQYVADMNTPLAMITAGATMAQTDVLAAFKKPRTLLLCFYRLLLIPLICAFVFKLFPVSQDVFTTIVIAAACPSATIIIMFAVSYDKNDLYASELFSISTLLSAITLPLLLIILNFM